MLEIYSVPAPYVKKSREEWRKKKADEGCGDGGMSRWVTRHEQVSNIKDRCPLIENFLLSYAYARINAQAPETRLERSAVSGKRTLPFRSLFYGGGGSKILRVSTRLFIGLCVVKSSQRSKHRLTVSTKGCSDGVTKKLIPCYRVSPHAAECHGDTVANPCI
jgi:hypothetical protein